jgi:hypothetical protein
VSAPTLLILAAGMGSRFGGLKQLAPVGPDGATPIDYAAADARAAGFGPVVLIVRSEIRDEIEAHVRTAWPSDVPVTYVLQDRDQRSLDAMAAGRTKPLGTAHAVVIARDALDGPFAVANADDLYGLEGYRLLASHLAGDGGHALVTYSLAKTLLGPGQVNRALCRVSGSELAAVDEGKVHPEEDGTFTWTSFTGDRTERLRGDEPVSMNLWGFQLSIVDELEASVAAFVAAGKATTSEESLLPDVVRSLLAAGTSVRAMHSSEPCLGVTHREDLPRLQAALDRSPAWG